MSFIPYLRFILLPLFFIVLVIALVQSESAGAVGTDSNTDYYQVLKLDRSASEDEIKKAYRREISLHHPDKFSAATSEQLAQMVEKAQKINEAYKVLGDAKNKLAYDQTRQTEATESFQTTPPRAAPNSPKKTTQINTQKNLADFAFLFKMAKNLSPTNKTLVALAFLEKRFSFVDNAVLINLPLMNSYMAFTQKLWFEHIFQVSYTGGDLEVMEIMLKTSFAQLKQLQAIHAATYQKSFAEGFRYFSNIYNKSQNVDTANQQAFRGMLSRVLTFATSSRQPEWSSQDYKVSLKSSLRNPQMMCREIFKF